MFGRRPDGIAVKDGTILRRMLPFVLRRRNDAVVFHEQVLDVSHTLRFIDQWNAEHDPPITVFHVVIAAICRTLDERRGLNRFVSRGRVFERHGVSVSFAIKREFAEYAPMRTIKLASPSGDTLEALVERLHTAVAAHKLGRSLRPVEHEARWLLRLPGWALRLIFVGAGWLDAWGLLPAALLANDPLFTSAFVANFGSIGLDRVQHHLYEHGSASLFCAIGEVCDRVLPDKHRRPCVVSSLRLDWTFDERINDAHYCVGALQRIKTYVENPAALLQGTDEDRLADCLTRDRAAAQRAHGSELRAV